MNFTWFFIHVFSLHLYCHQGRCPHDDLRPICLLLGRQTYSLPRESRVLLQRAQIFPSTSAEETYYIKQFLLGQADGGIWILCQACVHFCFQIFRFNCRSVVNICQTFMLQVNAYCPKCFIFPFQQRIFEMLISTEFLTEKSRQANSYALWC